MTNKAPSCSTLEICKKFLRGTGFHTVTLPLQDQHSIDWANVAASRCKAREKSVHLQASRLAHLAERRTCNQNIAGSCTSQIFASFQCVTMSLRFVCHFLVVPVPVSWVSLQETYGSGITQLSGQRGKGTLKKQ